MTLFRRALTFGLPLAASAALLACGDDSSKPSGTADDASAGSPTGNSANDTLVLRFSPMYSAYVPNHEALVPVTLKDASLRTSGAHFTSSDTSIATVADTANGATITVKKDGVVTIQASLDGQTGSAKLTVTKFTEEQWMAGQARFSKSDLAIKNPSGGALTPLLLRDPANRDDNGACNTCHTAQAKVLKIENTPTQIAGYSDSELITIFTEGAKPEGVAQGTMIPSFAWGMFHKWKVTDEEKQGLVAFLRTQAPKDSPAMIDYGIKPCADAGTSMSFCDADGKPIMFGPPGGGGGLTDAGTDSGTSVGLDAGTQSDAN